MKTHATYSAIGLVVELQSTVIRGVDIWHAVLSVCINGERTVVLSEFETDRPEEASNRLDRLAANFVDSGFARIS